MKVVLGARCAIALVSVLTLALTACGGQTQTVRAPIAVTTLTSAATLSSLAAARWEESEDVAVVRTWGVSQAAALGDP